MIEEHLIPDVADIVTQYLPGLAAVEAFIQDMTRLAEPDPETFAHQLSWMAHEFEIQHCDRVFVLARYRRNSPYVRVEYVNVTQQTRPFWEHFKHDVETLSNLNDNCRHNNRSEALLLRRSELDDFEFCCGPVFGGQPILEDMTLSIHQTSLQCHSQEDCRDDGELCPGFQHVWDYLQGYAIDFNGDDSIRLWERDHILPAVAKVYALSLEGEWEDGDQLSDDGDSVLVGAEEEEHGRGHSAPSDPDNASDSRSDSDV
jgi:hypothetical protein